VTARPSRLLAVLVLGAAGLLGGCGVVGDDNANGGLANTSWTVLSIAGTTTIAESDAALVTPMTPTMNAALHRFLLVIRAPC